MWGGQYSLPTSLAMEDMTVQFFPPSLSDFFSVTLIKNRSALEIGQSGQYLLSFRERAIVLHWRTGAIAHHWPQRSVVKFAIDHEKEGNLVLIVNRCGSFSVRC